MSQQQNNISTELDEAKNSVQQDSSNGITDSPSITSLVKVNNETDNSVMDTHEGIIYIYIHDFGAFAQLVLTETRVGTARIGDFLYSTSYSISFLGNRTSIGFMNNCACLYI